MVLFVIVIIGFVYVFVFFKQKTAYEMRISDWTSDVCSSDLRPVEHADRADLGGRQDDVETAVGSKNRHPEAPKTIISPHCRHAGLVPASNGQIGRASCRERVCQYV